METRIRRIEAIGAGDQRSGNVGASESGNVEGSGRVEATSLPPPVLGTASHEEALHRLGERVDVLEKSFTAQVQAAVERGIKEYLEAYGLGDQALRRLGDPITQSRMGWGIGGSSSGRVTPEGAPIFPSVGFSFGISKTSEP